MALTEINFYFENPTPMQVNEMFERANGNLGIENRTTQNRARRLGELTWTTLTKNLRSKDKQDKIRDQSHRDEDEENRE